MAREVKKISNNVPIELAEDNLFNDCVSIIESRKRQIVRQAKAGSVLMFWEVGKRINDEVLKNERAQYGKQIVVTVSRQLQEKYGASFNEKNVRRMIQFATQAENTETVNTVYSQLDWSHVIELLPLPAEQKIYYANEVRQNLLSVRGLRERIDKKAFERKEIANTQLTQSSNVPFNTFKDPYLLDTLGLKDSFIEADLEQAILRDLENFILEFGRGFAFVERQKRITVGNDDFYIDLLFYNRLLKRLVAVELKTGKFKPSFKGQMEFYLNWLNENERAEGENAPIGIILCPKADKDQIALTQADKSGIAVAEYWTELPPKKEFEEKIAQIMIDAQERLERRKQLGETNVQKHIEYFIESDDEE